WCQDFYESKEAPNDQIVLHSSGIPITQNAFQNLQDFPPITFAQATEKPSQISPSKTPEYLKKEFEEPITLLPFSNVPTKGDIQISFWTIDLVHIKAPNDCIGIRAIL
ncbi:hypothetical protein BVRB_043010, partial [Beta vulgaris subsp. vulgaris]